MLSMKSVYSTIGKYLLETSSAFIPLAGGVITYRAMRECGFSKRSSLIPALLSELGRLLSLYSLYTMPQEMYAGPALLYATVSLAEGLLIGLKVVG